MEIVRVGKVDILSSLHGIPLALHRQYDVESVWQSTQERASRMLIYEYKVAGTRQQYTAIDEAIRIVQLIRNKCLRLWMDTRGTNRTDLQCYCAVLARDYSFANTLNSQARQASADRAWAAISRFY